MKTVVWVLGIGLALSTASAAADIAISTQANWWSQTAADREMQKIANNVTGASVELFSSTQQTALADWVVAHTGDGASDLLILCGQLPNTLYPAGNTQPDGSLLELFLDDGNCIINTGDWIFYVVNSAGSNGTAALPYVMDISSMEMWDDDTPVTVTADGQKYTPSLVNFSTDRAIHLDSLEGDWSAELILALAADGNRAEPVILHNSSTGGRIGIFFQTANQDTDPRGAVISEWINNWYLPLVVAAKTATNPSPADGADEVLRDAVLGWAPGAYAATHDIYLGTNAAEVGDAGETDPKGVLVSQGQADAAYAAGVPFEYGQTYYWRVDEVNAAPDFTAFKGDVWSFTVEPYAYPITAITATASSFQAGMGPENTINGSGLNANDQHSTDSAAMWTSSGAMPAWIQYEFDKIYKLHELWVWNSNQPIETFLGMGAKTVAIEYSTDGETWTTLEGVPEFARAAANATYTANTIVEFGGVTAKYVKLTISANWGGMAPQTGLSEVRFFYAPMQAFEPDPADGEADVAVEAALNWRPGREATSHTVSLGTDSDAVATGAAATHTVTSHRYIPDSLDYATTYFWKIDEVGDAETVAGDVWSFTTEEYGVVDDFESYDNNKNRIYETWVDGFTDDASGSQVGYDESPFAEMTVVHGDRQSMPLLYNNTTFSFSQATRTFDSAQDWTARGVKSLAIHFAGLSGNTGTFYIKINSTKIVYDGDSSDLARIGWQAWNVDLSAVASVSSVRSLTIGVEGAGAAGKLYIDDIRLYPKAPEYIVPVQPATTNLVGYYTLDEGSGAKVNDSSGKGHHGAVEANPEWVAGMVGGAMDFGGDGDYVDLGNPADWPAGAEPRSMCAWLKTADLTATWHFAIAYGSPNTDQAMFIGLSGAGLYGGGYGDDVSLANFWEIDVWHHIALTYDGTTARLYADGLEVALAAKNWNLVRSRARIGQQVNDLNEFWDGAVDDVRIYNKALSAEEVAGLSGQTVPRHKPF